MTALATQPSPAPQPTIRKLLDAPSFKEQIARVLPKICTPERFVRVAITATMRTPQLAECSQASFFNALLRLAELGIEADGRRAHLIPFKRNVKDGSGRWSSHLECQLIIDYKGLAELAMRSGSISYLHADIVCENDEFKYDRGQITKHEIDFRKPRGKMYAAYAMCKFKDGTEKADVMTREEVEDIRARSKAGTNGPWVTDFNEMAKKTVFRRMSKWLPLSPEQRDAVDADDDAIIPAFNASELSPPARDGESATRMSMRLPMNGSPPNGHGADQGEGERAAQEATHKTGAVSEAPGLDDASIDNSAPSWDDLTEQGITRVNEEDGIAVQLVEGGMTLRPDGQWDANYGGWTVQPNNPEQDMLARTMAAKALATMPTSEADAPDAPPAPPAPRSSRPSPKR